MIIGKGHTAIETFLDTWILYPNGISNIASCYLNVAAQSMLQAVNGLRDNNNVSVNDIFDTSVSCDGTW